MQWIFYNHKFERMFSYEIIKAGADKQKLEINTSFQRNGSAALVRAQTVIITKLEIGAVKQEDILDYTVR